MTKLLIDADIYAYRSLSVTEDETDWGDDIWTLSSDVRQAKRNFSETLKRISEELGSEDYLLCCSSQTNFRKDLNPDYKSGRKKTR